MKLLDVNILVAAHRAEHPHHRAISAWFDDLDARGETYSVTEDVAVGFVRLATNGRIFDPPSPAEAVFGFLRVLRSRSTFVPLRSTVRRFELFESIVGDFQATGELAPDAYLAAVAIENGATMVSLDRDFARFADLDWERPAV
jgi:toxin-antitoxin system PIN domain toxin